MKLLNCMLGKGRGGLEQVALDYHEALALGGAQVQTVLHRDAALREQFAPEASIATLKPLGEWDVLAAHQLRHIACTHEADAILAHGNRAISLSLRALNGHIPVIGVAHNYKIQKRFPKCDAVFCITNDLMEEMVHLGIAREKLHHMPNMLRLPNIESRRWREPVTIGTLGRFVDKKGMDIFVQALGALRQQSVRFRAIIGGDGPLAPMLQQQVAQLGMADVTTFLGWVKDKDAFFRELDLFILPSHHEPFGLVLIEAMASGLPVITTDTEGPCEIITHEQDAIMIPKAKPYAMAAAIQELIEQPERTLSMGVAARKTVQARYDLAIISGQLIAALRQIVSRTT